jgi:Tfp pilus assembly protein PilV
VLIAVTVVSMVLGGAYVTTNKSLMATRAAQEQSSALKLTESQLEQLKGLVVSNPNSIFTTAAPFCIYNQVNVVAATDPRCTQDAAGLQTTQDPKYTIAITRTNNDFSVKTTWEDVSGKKTDQMSLKYRAYQ